MANDSETPAEAPSILITCPPCQGTGGDSAAGTCRLCRGSGSIGRAAVAEALRRRQAAVDRGDGP